MIRIEGGEIVLARESFDVIFEDSRLAIIKVYKKEKEYIEDEHEGRATNFINRI